MRKKAFFIAFYSLFHFMTVTLSISGVNCEKVIPHLSSNHYNKNDVTQSEIFSSTSELLKLLITERDIVLGLKKYVTDIEKDILLIKDYIQDFEEIESVGEESSKIIANSINDYRILKRTTIDWANVSKALENTASYKKLADLLIEKSQELPTFEDFLGGSIALVSLQDTYNLNLTDMIQGSVGQNFNLPKSPYKLSARDCLFLGKTAFNKGLYNRAAEWLKSAIELAQEESINGTPTATEEEIRPFLMTTYRIHDEVLEKKGPSGENWQTNNHPLNEGKAKSKDFKKFSPYSPKIFEVLTPSEEGENFKRLCRGDDLRGSKIDARLRCRIIQKLNTKSIIGPFKIEEFSLSPYIIGIHNFMSDREMETFRNIARNRLRRSLHQGKNGQYVATDIRTSKQAWLMSIDDPLVDKMSQRISEVTGLETFPENEAAELFQVANYGMGGKYTSHTDFITGKDQYTNPLEVIRGNRIATFMTYLENVYAGGSTVFPLIGVKVKPEKGMSVFWWNLKRDGTGDHWTRHGGCPVLYGEKWIANKWIRINTQFLKVPCDLDEDADFTSINDINL